MESIVYVWKVNSSGLGCAARYVHTRIFYVYGSVNKDEKYTEADTEPEYGTLTTFPRCIERQSPAVESLPSISSQINLVVSEPRVSVYTCV